MAIPWKAFKVEFSFKYLLQLLHGSPKRSFSDWHLHLDLYDIFVVRVSFISFFLYLFLDFFFYFSKAFD